MTQKGKRDFMSVTEAAAYHRVSRTLLLRWINKGRFPNALKVGRQFNLPTEDVKNFVRKGAGRPKGEQEQ